MGAQDPYSVVNSLGPRTTFLSEPQLTTFSFKHQRIIDREGAKLPSLTTTISISISTIIHDSSSWGKELRSAPLPPVLLPEYMMPPYQNLLYATRNLGSVRGKGASLRLSPYHRTLNSFSRRFWVVEGRSLAPSTPEHLRLKILVTGT